MSEWKIDGEWMQWDPPMFIDISEPMQNPKFSGLVGIPFMVWLKRFDDLDSSVGHIFQCALKTLLPSLVINANDREAGSIVISTARTSSESGCEMIERTTEAGDKITRH